MNCSSINDLKLKIILYNSCMLHTFNKEKALSQNVILLVHRMLYIYIRIPKFIFEAGS